MLPECAYVELGFGSESGAGQAVDISVVMHYLASVCTCAACYPYTWTEQALAGGTVAAQATGGAQVGCFAVVLLMLQSWLGVLWPCSHNGTAVQR